MNLFLKAKHWQLFIFLIVIPFFVQLLFMGTILFNVFQEAAFVNTESDIVRPDFDNIFNNLKYIPLLVVFYIIIYLSWFWSLGVGLQKFVPKQIKLPVTRFKIFLIIPFTYILLITLLIISIMGSFVDIFEDFGSTDSSVAFDRISSLLAIFFIIFPLHIFSIFCIFHSIYFIAKTIKTVELQKEVVFGDFVGEFFLMWFYYIGIWIIQPKVNKFLTTDFTTVETPDDVIID